jgi:ACR3 family arsenite efflux pump ArsB
MSTESEVTAKHDLGLLRALPFPMGHIACPSALIVASNFFELAVTTAISLFGFNSGADLAIVVVVLIEVPVILVVARVVNNSRKWYEGYQF